MHGSSRFEVKFSNRINSVLNTVKEQKPSAPNPSDMYTAPVDIFYINSHPNNSQLNC